MVDTPAGTPGLRQPDGKGTNLLQPGDYTKWGNTWYACGPTNHVFDVPEKRVTLHDDGVISVDGELLVRSRTGVIWRGVLKRGVWFAK